MNDITSCAWDCLCIWTERKKVNFTYPPKATALTIKYSIPTTEPPELPVYQLKFFWNSLCKQIPFHFDTLNKLSGFVMVKNLPNVHDSHVILLFNNSYKLGSSLLSKPITVNHTTRATTRLEQWSLYWPFSREKHDKTLNPSFWNRK